MNFFFAVYVLSIIVGLLIIRYLTDNELDVSRRFQLLIWEVADSLSVEKKAFIVLPLLLLPVKDIV